MGSKSKSSTSTTSQVTNTQEIEQREIALEEANESNVIQGGGDVNAVIQLSDQGAIRAGQQLGEAAIFAVEDFGDTAFEFATENTRSLERGLSETLDFGGGVVADALAFSEGQTDKALDFGGDVFDRALDFGERESDRAQDATDSALRALGQGINTVGQLSRSDAADSVNKIALYATVAVGLIAAAYAFSKR